MIRFDGYSDIALPRMVGNDSCLHVGYALEGFKMFTYDLTARLEDDS